MKRISCEWIFDMVERVVDSYVGRPVPGDQVASKGRRSIGNVGNDFDSVQRGSKLGRMIHLISGIEWGDD